jgi:hypothetical protein
MNVQLVADIVRRSGGGPGARAQGSHALTAAIPDAGPADGGWPVPASTFIDHRRRECVRQAFGAPCAVLDNDSASSSTASRMRWATPRDIANGARRAAAPTALGWSGS